MLSDHLLKDLCHKHTSAVMATVLSSDGNGPARPGDRLLFANGQLIAGTVGGGSNERQVLQACAELSTKEHIIEISSFLPGILPSCGGILQIKLTQIDFGNPEEVLALQKVLSETQRGKLYLMGAGHVAKEVAWLADRNAFRVLIADPREALMKAERFPESCNLHCSSGEHFLSHNPPDTRDYIIIAGPDHAADLAMLEKAATSSAHYIGVMGSRKKIGSFKEILQKKKLWHTVAERIHAPIGISISSKTPTEVAVSIVAELIQIRAHPSIKQ